MIYGKCETCRKSGWFPKKRKLYIPHAGEAVSKKTMCRKCHKALKIILKIVPR